MNAMALSDHAAVELDIDINTDSDRKGRWRLNISLLQDETFKLSLLNDLKSFYEINAGSTETKAMVWEASKACQGEIIAHASRKKKENLNKIKDLESIIKNQEKELSKQFTYELYQDICKVNFQLEEMYNKKGTICTIQAWGNFL